MVSEWILGLVGSPWTYVGLALVIGLGGVLVPLPSQSLVVALTTLVHSRDGAALSLVWVFVAAVAGMTSGDYLAFSLTKRASFSDRSWTNGDRLRRLRLWSFQKVRAHPQQIMITARLIPMGRFATNMTAANVGIPTRRFLQLSTVAGIVWAAYSIGIGSVAGVWAEDRPILMTVIAVLVASAFGLVIQYAHNRITGRRASRG